MKTETLHIDGMTCMHCQKTIHKALINTKGVKRAKVSFQKAIAEIAYNEHLTSLNEIKEVINKKGYKVVDKEEQRDERIRLVAILIILLSLSSIAKNLGMTSMLPQVQQSMGYGMLFVIGLMTSVHCVGMCGGLHLPHSIHSNKKIAIANSVAYNAGRVFAYAAVGGIVGLVGSVFSLSNKGKGFVSFISGIFMIIMGLNMLNIFPWLKKIQINIPWYKLLKIKKKENKTVQSKSFFVGMLNALIPCGPLQTLQLYALGTGSALAGFMSMVIFGLGTVPLMLGIMITSTVLNTKFSQNILKVSSMLIVVMGISALGRGYNLSGISFNINFGSERTTQEQTVTLNEHGIQEVSGEITATSYPNIEVKAGIPVKLNLVAKQGQLNGCNNALIIPELGIEKQLNIGDNIIEFTPEQRGNITYTCWMGMRRGNIRVS